MFVRDVAYKTWLALASYFYTGSVAFSRLRSTAAGKKRETIVPPMPHDPPLCSPKSMYRLADKYGLHDLKKLSLENIRSQLTADNIVPELFSRFTSRYAEVRDLEVKLLSTTRAPAAQRRCYDGIYFEFGSKSNPFLVASMITPGADGLMNSGCFGGPR